MKLIDRFSEWLRQQRLKNALEERERYCNHHEWLQDHLRHVASHRKALRSEFLQPWQHILRPADELDKLTSTVPPFAAGELDYARSKIAKCDRTITKLGGEIPIS